MKREKKQKNAKTKIIILAIFFVFSLSACSFDFQKTEEISDWEDEILMAQECGLEGLSCCLNNDSPCEADLQCCFDPNNPTINVCSSDCECGVKDFFCCENEKCGDNLSCSDGYCLECGEKGDLCCDDNDVQCGDGLLCHLGYCRECGELDSPCCSEEPLCKYSEGKDELRMECFENICKNCGRADFRGCREGSACDEGFFLNNEFCMQCGGYNQPCCAGSCNAELDLTCVYGFCVEEAIN